MNYTLGIRGKQDELNPPSHRGVYLIHFDEPISPNHTTQHYLGYADNIEFRIGTHVAGGSNSARLTQVAKERGIGFRLVRAWVGGKYDRNFERKLKNQKNAPRLCPCCNEKLLGSAEFSNI
jgi:hypothetical protein